VQDLLRDVQWRLCILQLLDLGDVAWEPTNACPEGLDEWAFREDVVRRLHRCLANFAGCIVEDVLAGQGLTAVDPDILAFHSMSTDPALGHQASVFSSLY